MLKERIMYILSGVKAEEDGQTSDAHVPRSSEEQTVYLRYVLIPEDILKKIKA